MRLPCGDQLGCTASSLPTSLVLRVVTSTSQSWLTVLRCEGPATPSVAKAIFVPSGDQQGLKPAPVKRRTAPPVVPMTKTPPPSRSERKAIWEPSGEKAGWVSSLAESEVRSIVLPPPTG